MRNMMLFIVLLVLLDPTVGQVTPSAVYVDTLRSFNGVPTDPECTNGGPLDTAPGANDNFACNIQPASRLTDGVLGESSPANFNQFSAWNRTTDMPRVFFQFSNTFPSSTFYIRQIDLYYYKSAALRVGLPDVRIDIANSLSIMQSLPVSYTIVSDQSISESDNQTVKISLVDTLGQRNNAYFNNVIVRLTFDFSSSDTLDWLLLSEVRMFNDTAPPLPPPPPQPPIIFPQDQVTVVRHNATDLVSSERLTCSVINEAAFEWSWTGPNGATTNVFVADLTRTGVLQISSLTLSDAGDYNCTAAFLTAGAIPLQSQNSSTISLQLEGLVTPSDPVSITNGGDATLSCKFSGYLPRNPTFSWENSQGMTISDNSKFTIQSTMNQTMLTIGSVIPTDSDNYTCRMRGDNNAELSGLAQLLQSIMNITTAVPTSSTTPVSVDSTPILTAALITVVAISILLSGVSIVLCLLYKRRTQKTPQTVLAETANASVENLEDIDPIYEDIDDISGMEHLVATENVAYGATGVEPSFSQVPVTENVAYGVTGVSDGFLDVSGTGNVAVEISAEMMAVLMNLQLRDAPYEVNGVDGSPDGIAAGNVDYEISAVDGSSEMSATGNIVDSTSDVTTTEKSIT